MDKEAGAPDCASMPLTGSAGATVRMPATPGLMVMPVMVPPAVAALKTKRSIVKGLSRTVVVTVEPTVEACEEKMTAVLGPGVPPALVSPPRSVDQLLLPPKAAVCSAQRPLSRLPCQ